MLRARALEQALRMLIDAAVQTACKIAEDGDRRWHVVDLVCATNDAEKLLAVDPPPSGASQFAIGEIVGIQGTLNVLLAEIDKLTAQPTCRVCGGYGFSAQKQTIDDGWGEVDTCPACSDQPAPVSPVEPTPEPETDLIGLVLNLQAYAREHGWQDCDEPIAALLAWRRIEPTPAPETCEWRYSADAEWWQSGCDSQDLSGDERLVGPDEKAKFCPYCGAKLVGR